MTEIWEPVKGYKGRYEVSSLGRVKSIARLVKRPGSPKGDQRRTERLLALHPNPKGYFTVRLSKRSVWRTRTVHRLVAVAFILNPENKPQLNHKNGVKTDNQVKNLEWATNQENQDHAWAIGLNRCRPKWLVTCPELQLSAEGIRGMVDLLRLRGYPAKANGIQRAMWDGGKHQGLRFTAKEINDAAN